MSENHPNRRWWLWFTGTTVAWFLCFYLISCASLLVSLAFEAGDFSSAAQNYYIGYITWIHIKLLFGYMIVAALLVLLFFPYVRTWQKRRPASRRRTILRTTIIVLVTTFLVGSRILYHPHLAKGWFGSIYRGLGWTVLGYLTVEVLLALVVFFLVRKWWRRKQITRRKIIVISTIAFIITFVTAIRIFYNPYYSSGVLASIYTGIDWALSNGIRLIFSPYSIGALILLFILGSILIYGYMAYGKIRSKGLRASAAAATALLALLAGALISVSTYASPGIPGPKPDNPEPGPKPWNILILSCDSLRGDHLSCYGYERNPKTTPKIDMFAKESVNFTRAMTPIADTLSSWMTVFTSQYPNEHHIRYIYPQPEVLRVAEKGRTYLPKLLAEKGYETIAMGDWCASCFKWLDMGFQEIDVSDVQTFKVVLGEYIYKHHLVILMFFNNPLGRKIFPELKNFSGLVTPDTVTDWVVRRLRKSRDSEKPFFMTVFYSCTHLPYKSNEPYSRRYKNPEYHGPNEYEVHLKVRDIIEQNYPGSSDHEELSQVYDKYDNSVSEFDGNVGRILRRLKKLGLMENTIVVITADHGEDLYDPGTSLGHGLNFNGGDQSNHVPLIIRVPDVLYPPGRVDRMVRLIDLGPTLTDLLGLERPESFRGRSLLPYLEGSEEDMKLLFYGEEGFAFGAKKPDYDILWDMPPVNELFELDNTFDSNMVVRRKYHDKLIESRERCIATDRWKVVRRVLKSGPSYSLYDKRTDPHCLRDISAERPDVFVPMVRWLDEWLETNADRSGEPRPFSDE